MAPALPRFACERRAPPRIWILLRALVSVSPSASEGADRGQALRDSLLASVLGGVAADHVGGEHAVRRSRRARADCPTSVAERRPRLDASDLTAERRRVTLG